MALPKDYLYYTTIIIIWQKAWNSLTLPSLLISQKFLLQPNNSFQAFSLLVLCCYKQIYTTGMSKALRACFERRVPFYSSLYNFR